MKSLRPTVTCGRCQAKVSVHGLVPHRRACLQTPRPADLVAIFLTGEYESTEALAVYYKVGTLFVEQRLRQGGIDPDLINETRTWLTHAVRPRHYEKCSRCEIYVVEDGQELPEGWTATTNGRVIGNYLEHATGQARTGVLCRACADGC